MLSKMGGKVYGVAKRITPVMTTMDYNTYVNENFLDGLSKIYDDVVQNNNPGNCIINISINWILDSEQFQGTSRFVSQVFIQRVGFIIQQLIALGVPVITGSGNGGGVVNGYPALFRDPTVTPNIPEILVVGSVDVLGTLSTNSKSADYVTVYAPGRSRGIPFGPEAISCASSVGTIASPKDGTSICKLSSALKSNTY